MSDANKIPVLITTVKCGVGGDGHIEVETQNTPIHFVPLLKSYIADGAWTPLFDSVGEAIKILESAPDAKNPEVSFLVQVITDGVDNHSVKYYGHLIGDMITRLNGSDRWTFTFRVPNGGYARQLERLGIPGGNIIEWKTTEEGLRESTQIMTQAVSNYYGGVTRGVRSTNSFYADLSGVKKGAVSGTMTNISKEVRIWPVTNMEPKNWKGNIEIGPFVEQKTRTTYKRGTAFYELVKTEKAVQATKTLVIRNAKDGSVYAGQSARDILGLPTQGTIKLSPGNFGDWELFIQSTSSNRILPVGTKVLYWNFAGTR